MAARPVRVALVRVVDDHRAKVREERVEERGAEEPVRRRDEQPRLLGRPAAVARRREAHRVAHSVAAELVREALREVRRRRAPRLRGHDAARRPRPAALDEVARELRRLAGARLADDDQRLRGLERVQELVAVRRDRPRAAAAARRWRAHAAWGPRAAGPRVSQSVREPGELL